MNMAKHSKWVKVTLVIITIVIFFIFLIPNSRASENIAMVSMFEPDEGIMIPVIQKMLEPKGNFKYFLIKFALYEYYYYGFPFFALSAIVTLPFQLAGQMGNIPWLMTTLRQLVSVLPMLLALLLLVDLHDRFKSYKSIILYLFLLMVPAVVQNGFWWHPDGLVLLLSVLVLYFLYRDGHKLGWQFVAAAFFCSVLTATKLVGGYFFLAVGLTILWSVLTKSVSWKKAILMSVLFLLIMAVTFVIANPFMIFEAHRELYFKTIRKQSSLLSQGYGIFYNKGLIACWPLMHEYYGEAVFLIATIGITIWNILKKETRFMHALTLAWFIPLTVSVLTFSHFKYQYWLPVAIPLFANWVTVLSENKKILKAESSFIKKILRIGLLLIFVAQFVLFGVQSSKMMVNRIYRKEKNANFIFYELAMEKLEPIGEDPIYAYYDYRLYMPKKENWTAETAFKMLDYEHINSRNFDVLFLLEQRMHDYTNPNVVGIDPESFTRAQEFYRDALEGNIDGYCLLLRTETAHLYVREDFCLKYFEPEVCQ
jgi:hypothetical protein